jgi:hypothetical protein
MDRKILFILLGFLLIYPDMKSQGNNDYFVVGGVIKNAKNKKAIEYVNVSAVGTNVGTIANENGEFTLKISRDLQVNEIEFSRMGYSNVRYTIENSDWLNRTFLMEPYAKELKEVEVISWKSPEELVRIAVEKIPHNYPLEPNLLTGFYRETAQKGKNYINISEAVIQIYKTSYKHNSGNDKVQISKGRKLISPNKNDTLAVKLLGGPNLSVVVDIVKNPDVLLSPDFLSYYKYRMGDPVSINDRIQYVVHFEPQISYGIPLYFGVFYIDRETLAFTRAEFNMDMKHKDKVTAIILKSKPTGLRFTPDELSYIVSYHLQDGHSVLNYMHNEIKFRCDWKRRLFATRYTIVSEMVVTDNQKENISKITQKESFSKEHSLSDEVDNYFDKDFWGAYNIIEPTESLESAVGKLKKTD